jgi:hypothetical protein
VVYAAQRYSELAAADKVGMTLKSEVAVDKPPALVHAALVRTYIRGQKKLIRLMALTPVPKHNAD